MLDINLNPKLDLALAKSVNFIKNQNITIKERDKSRSTDTEEFREAFENGNIRGDETAKIYLKNDGYYYEDPSLDLPLDKLLCLLSDIYQEAELWAAAVRELDKAILIKPNRREYYLSRAYAKTRLKDMKGAHKDANKAMSFDNDCPLALMIRSIVRYCLRNFDGARQDYQRAKKSAESRREYLEMIDAYAFIDSPVDPKPKE